MPDQRLRIHQLRVGDVLLGSGTTVLVAPTAGVRTPSGRMDLKVRWPSGSERWHCWGRHTEVTVRRP